MNNKTDIEEDIKICDELKKFLSNDITPKFTVEQSAKAIENILADRERLIVENKKLNTEIAEHVYIESMPIKEAKQLQSKANKYDSLIERIEKKFNFYNSKVKDIRESNIKHYNATKYDYLIVGQRDAFQELLDIEKEN